MDRIEKYTLIAQVQHVRTTIRVETLGLPDDVHKDRLQRLISELDDVIETLIKQ